MLVSALKQHIADNFNLDVDRQRIIFKGKVLRNEQDLSFYCISFCATVCMWMGEGVGGLYILFAKMLFRLVATSKIFCRAVLSVHSAELKEWLSRRWRNSEVMDKHERERKIVHWDHHPFLRLEIWLGSVASFCFRSEATSFRVCSDFIFMFAALAGNCFFTKFYPTGYPSTAHHFTLCPRKKIPKLHELWAPPPSEKLVLSEFPLIESRVPPPPPHTHPRGGVSSDLAWHTIENCSNWPSSEKFWVLVV